jgi:hypothetical protein
MSGAEPPGTIGGTEYTIEDLSDYLDRGREPRIEAIETDAECRAVLDRLSRLGSLSRDLVQRDVERDPTIDEGWLTGLLQSIGREVRAGRDIPLSSPDPSVTLAITEGAVRELVRNAGDSVDGVLVGSTRIDGDVVGQPLTVHLAISVLLTAPVRELAEAVRQRVYSELLKHTELQIAAVDVTVTDGHELLSGKDDQA